MTPVVAIVGRPNVGKSTLFNRIIGKRKAIVGDEPGVTRDLNYATVEELGRVFTLVDTGGFESETTDEIFLMVREQMHLAIEDSDVIVFLMDGKSGPSADDKELVRMLRKADKPVVYAVNKLDTVRQQTISAEFYSVGVKELVAVSAEGGAGVNELIDAIVHKLPDVPPPVEEEKRTRIAIVGRPNVGKSSLLNRLTGTERAIVSPIAGTTRDPVDMPLDRGPDGRYLFIDTAGIRRKTKISLTIEGYSVMEAIRSIDRADVVLLVLDATAGLTAQDEKIASLIDDRKRCCIITVNKWDLAEKDTHTVEYVTETLKKGLPNLTFAPVVFTSALTGQRVQKVFEIADGLVAKSALRVKTSVMNDVLTSIEGRCSPPVYRGKKIKFYYITQSGVFPPTFVIFTNSPEGVAEAYKRYMISSLREALGMEDIPIKVFYRERH